MSEHQDPRTLVPMDPPVIRRSVQKIGHVNMVDEVHTTGSAAAEISAQITEDPVTFRALQSPPMRGCAPNVPIPYSPPDLTKSRTFTLSFKLDL